jgi:Short-chain dehydrogenases of various substrate specificities
MGYFNNKTVAITGASSGIGLACAYEFGKRGASLALAARNMKELEKLQVNLTNLGYPCLISQVDVSIENDCKRFATEVISRFGKVDVLINNAGISMRAIFDDLDLSVIHQLMNVNFWGTVYCTKYFYSELVKAKGSLVGVSSVAGFHGLPARTGYSASKYAMHGFLETIRIENLNTGLHVMIAAPGFTASNVRKNALTADGSAQGESPREEGKMMTSEEVAIKIANGVVRRKRQLVMDFDGKATIFLKFFAPKLLDRLFYNHMAKEPNSTLK